jgi:regulatory protein
MRAKRSADGEPEDWTAASVEAAAVRLLARREHSRAELVRKLAARGAPAELADEVLDSLAARRLQSDERYAESLVTSRIGRGQGPVRIRRELAERGVGAPVERRRSRPPTVTGAGWPAMCPAATLRRQGARRMERARAPVALPRIPGLQRRADPLRAGRGRRLSHLAAALL